MRAPNTTRAPNSARRCHSYRTRGNYASQLQDLRRYYPDQQILIIDNSELVERHDQTLARVCKFLEVADDNLPASMRIFAGDYDRDRHGICRWLLKCWFSSANRRLKNLLSEMGYSPNWPWLR